MSTVFAGNPWGILQFIYLVHRCFISTLNNIFSESSPEQGSMVAIGKPPYKLPPTMKRSVMIDKKSAEGVWALLGLANSQPKTK